MTGEPNRTDLLAIVDKIRGGTRDGWGYGRDECVNFIATIISQQRAAVVQTCAEKIGNMRQSEAGLLDEKHCGQRGCDRSDALYDAYQAVMTLAKEST